MEILRISSVDTTYHQISREIRYRVFVGEQLVPEELEYDEFEEECHHYLVLINNVGAATCRWRKTGIGIKLERFAVLAEHRSKGLGAFMVRHLLEEVLPFKQTVYLHAQEKVVDFYAKFGFRAKGNRFEEAGIMHYLMEYHHETD
ncbi:MAG: GNAT family N-acetyltransferase [Lentimicrobium sp.]|nr:GNAT family N-acetyltransferase [Lentimicrobium sp.]